MKKLVIAVLFIFLLGNMASATVDANVVRDFPELCASGTPEQVAEAVAKIGDVNAITYGDGFSMLMIAAMKNPNVKVMEVLLKAGADLKAVTSGKGHTALTSAAMEASPEVVSYLLRAGSNVNDKSKIGNSAIALAVNYNPNIEVARLLLSAGADPNVANNSGWTPLMSVAEGKTAGNVMQLFDMLIKAGANINAKSSSGETVLMVLANANIDNIPLLATFLQYGADANAVANDGKTVLDYVKNANLKTDGYRILEAATKGPLTISGLPTITPPTVTPSVATPPIPPTLPVITPPAPPVITPPVVVPPPPPTPKTFNINGTWVTLYNNQYMYMKIQGNQYQAWMNGANALSENGYFQYQNNVIQGVNQISGNNFAYNVRFSDDGMYMQLTDANGNGFQYQRVQ